jgi:hypothetical protein
MIEMGRESDLLSLQSNCRDCSGLAIEIKELGKFKVSVIPADGLCRSLTTKKCYSKLI